MAKYVIITESHYAGEVHIYGIQEQPQEGCNRQR